MNDQTFVCCHPPNLASLLFETACSFSNQMGFLLGTIKKQVVVSATDENEANEENKTVIYVEHCVPILNENVFGPYGEVKEMLMKNYLLPHKGKIVGWYSFRRNTSSTQCTLQESLIHKSLLDCIDNAKRETFTFALLTTSVHDRYSTHTFSQTFLRLSYRDIFEPIRLKIYNLSDKVGNSSGFIQETIFPMSKTFDEITGIHKENGVPWVENVYSSSYKELAQLSRTLAALEKDRCNLELEIQNLRQLISSESSVPQYISKQKEKLMPKFLKFNPDFNYDNENLGDPMVENEVEEEKYLMEKTGSASQESLRKLPEMQNSEQGKVRPTMSYAAATVVRSINDSGVKSPNTSGIRPKPMEH